MRLLVLGGTKFLGRATVSAALDRSDDVTIFTRGHTNPELFPEAEHLVGNRDGDLSALRGREWDVVIDTCGYVPRVVRASTEMLAESIGTYVFVSSGSVYPMGTPPGHDESAPTERLDEPASEQVEKYYGALKAACEREVQATTGATLRVLPFEGELEELEPPTVCARCGAPASETAVFARAY